MKFSRILYKLFKLLRNIALFSSFFFSSFSFRFFFFFDFSFFFFFESFRFSFSSFLFVCSELSRLHWIFEDKWINRISFLLWNNRDMIRDNSSLISKNHAQKHMIWKWLFFNESFFFSLSKDIQYFFHKWIIEQWFIFRQFFQKFNHWVWKIIYLTQMMRTSILRAFDFFIIRLFQVKYFSLNWQETIIFAVLFKSRHREFAIIVEFINHWFIFSIALRLTIVDDCISIVDTKSTDEIKCEASRVRYRYYVKLWMLFGWSSDDCWLTITS